MNSSVTSFLNAHRIRLDNLVFQYQQGLLTDEYYETRVKQPLRRFVPHWDVAGVRWNASCPSFSAAVHEALGRPE